MIVCDSDSDCPPGQVCMWGACFKEHVGEVESITQICSGELYGSEEDEELSEESIESTGLGEDLMHCDSDSDCPPGQVCMWGACFKEHVGEVVPLSPQDSDEPSEPEVSIEPTGLGEDLMHCDSDSDCPPGQVCMWGACFKEHVGEVEFITELVGCVHDSDCGSGQVCVIPPGKEGGICTDVGSVAVLIEGIVDERTCGYCLSQIGTIRSIDSANLPPFHKHCRCGWSYV